MPAKNKIHTTNYENTFILIAEDSPASKGSMPPVKEGKTTIANYQFDFLFDKPYRHTSDEILFSIFATRKEIEKRDLAEAKETFFSKGQPCFRASPLPKQYGWGIHSNAEGKVAMHGAESERYQQLLEDDGVKKVRAMRSKRK